MIRVRILKDGWFWLGRIVKKTAHFKDEELPEAEQWARDRITKPDGTFATLYHCEDEHSPSVGVIGDVFVSLCDSCKVNSSSGPGYFCDYSLYPGADKIKCKFYRPRWLGMEASRKVAGKVGVTHIQH